MSTNPKKRAEPKKLASSTKPAAVIKHDEGSKPQEPNQLDDLELSLDGNAEAYVETVTYKQAKAEW